MYTLRFAFDPLAIPYGFRTPVFHFGGRYYVQVDSVLGVVARFLETSLPNSEGLTPIKDSYFAQPGGPAIYVFDTQGGQRLIGDKHKLSSVLASELQHHKYPPATLDEIREFLRRPPRPPEEIPKHGPTSEAASGQLPAMNAHLQFAVQGLSPEVLDLLTTLAVNVSEIHLGKSPERAILRDTLNEIVQRSSIEEFKLKIQPILDWNSCFLVDPEVVPSRCRAIVRLPEQEVEIGVIRCDNWSADEDAEEVFGIEDIISHRAPTDEEFLRFAKFHG